MARVGRSLLGGVAAALLVGTSSATAAPKGVCATVAEGRWIIVSYSFRGISGLTEADAKRLVGKTVVVTPAHVQFADRSCPIASTEAEMWPGEFDGFPYVTVFNCKSDLWVPGIFVGASCDEARSNYEGVYLRLKRAPAR